MGEARVKMEEYGNEEWVESPSSSGLSLTELPRDVLQQILKRVCIKRNRDRECVGCAKWVAAAAMSCRGMQQAASRDLWLWFLRQFTGLRLSSLSFPEGRVSLSELCYSMARNHRELEAQFKVHSLFFSPQSKAKAAEILSLLFSSKGRTIFVPPMIAHSPQVGRAAGACLCTLMCVCVYMCVRSVAGAVTQSLRPYDGTLHFLSAVGGNGIYVVESSRELMQMASQVLRRDLVPRNMGVYMKPFYYDGSSTLKSPDYDPELLEDKSGTSMSACNNRYCIQSLPFSM